MISQIWYTRHDNPTTRLLKIEGTDAIKLGIQLAFAMVDTKEYKSVFFDDMKSEAKEVFKNEGMGITG